MTFLNIIDSSTDDPVAAPSRLDVATSTYDTPASCSDADVSNAHGRESLVDTRQGLRGTCTEFFSGGPPLERGTSGRWRSPNAILAPPGENTSVRLTELR